MKFGWPLVIRRVRGHSMVPVLPPGTRVVGWAWVGLVKGDVIIFEHEDKEMVRRIREVLGDGSLFVAGEHPETSRDSRHFGAIDPADVIAKVIWPDVHVKE